MHIRIAVTEIGLIKDRRRVRTVPDIEPDTVFIEHPDRVEEIAVLLLREFRTAVGFVRHGKMRKDAFCFQTRQAADRKCVGKLGMPVPMLKSDSAHAAVDLNMDLDPNTVGHCRLRERFAVGARIDTLRDILLCQHAGTFRRCISKNQDRQRNLSLPKLECFLQIGYGKKISAQRFIERGKAHRIMSVSVCLDDAADLGFRLDRRPDLPIVPRSTVEIDLRPCALANPLQERSPPLNYYVFTQEESRKTIRLNPSLLLSAIHSSFLNFRRV